jgi:hypothetical protein
MVISWQISYGLPASVHVTDCPGAGIGGRLHVPAGAATCGREDCALEVKAVSIPKSNTDAAVKILRVKRCLNTVVVFMFGVFAATAEATCVEELGCFCAGSATDGFDLP